MLSSLLSIAAASVLTFMSYIITTEAIYHKNHAYMISILMVTSAFLLIIDIILPIGILVIWILAMTLIYFCLLVLI